MKKLAAPRILSLLLALMLVIGLSPAALAAVPDRPENKYVLDSAGVLSEDTEKRIIAENQDLFEDCGAEIVVVAVDFLGGQDIKDYVYKMFKSWGVGSVERNNGILLVLAIGEEDYRCQAGYGIDDYFNGELISGILDEYLEPDFAAEDYDAGVLKTFNALLDEVKGYYRTGPGRNDPAPEYSDDGWDEDQGFNVSPFRALKTIAIAILRVIVVVAVILFVFSLFRGPGGRGSGGGGGGGFWRGMWLGSMMGNRRRGYWGAPPPPPPFGGPGPRPGGFGRGPGGFGGFHGGGGSRGGGGGRGFGGGGGGFHGGGGSHGGGAGRH